VTISMKEELDPYFVANKQNFLLSGQWSSNSMGQDCVHASLPLCFCFPYFCGAWPQELI
jgi:hypothetical protein